MRLSPNSPRPRKSLKAMSNRYSSNYMQKYHDVNVIHFDKNMSMTNKINTIKFARCPTGNFKPHLMSDNFLTGKKTLRDWSTDTACFDFSSDDRATATTSTTNSPASESSTRDTETDDCICDYSDCARTNGLDSFCTLCTSSFSYNRCNRCETSSCGSKCNSPINGSSQQPKDGNTLPEYQSHR